MKKLDDLIDRKKAGALIVLLIIAAAVMIFTACEDTLMRQSYKAISGAAEWTESDQLLPDSGAADDNFGRSAAISGDYAIVGSPLNDDMGNSKGAAFLYKWNSKKSLWEYKTTLYGDYGTSYLWEYFGCSVDIDGEYLVVGAQGYSIDGSNPFRGAVYIYKINTDSTCTLQEKVIGEENNDELGYSVAIHGDYAIAGAPGYNSDEGRAYIYERNGTDWDYGDAGKGIELKKSDGPSFGFNPDFGKSVDIDGLYATVGAPGHDQIGKVYVYNNIDGTWGTSGFQEDDSIVSPNGQSGDQFGTTVSQWQELLAVGSLGNGGFAHVFNRSGGFYSLSQSLEDPKKTNLDSYGGDVAVYGDWILVGSAKADSNGTDSGALTLFFYFDSEWMLFDKFTSLKAGAYETFGNALGIDGDTLVVGAQCDTGELAETGSAFIYQFE